MSNSTSPPLLALTQGEPAGIGPEIIWQALARDPDLLRHVLVVGDVAVLERAQAWVASQPSYQHVEGWQIGRAQRLNSSHT